MQVRRRLIARPCAILDHCETAVCVLRPDQERHDTPHIHHACIEVCATHESVRRLRRFLHSDLLRFAGELRPIVGGFDVPPWSAIARFWPLVWLAEIW